MTYSTANNNHIFSQVDSGKDIYSPRRAQRYNLLILWGSLFALVVADGILTEYLVAYRFGVESNPFLIALVGNLGFLLLKCAGAALAIFFLQDISKRNYKLALSASILFVLFYILIVFWNLFAFLNGFSY